MDWNPQGARDEDRSKPGKGPFWRKQKNAETHGSRLRGWRATESDGDTSQMPYVPNGTKGYTTVILKFPNI